MSNTILPDETYQKNRVAAHVRNTTMLLLGVVLLLILVMVGTITISITGRASTTLARLYAIEATRKFNLQMYQNLVLVKKISLSKNVARWFADEDNPTKRASAYDEITGVTDILQNTFLASIVHDSLNEYSINFGNTYADFLPFRRIDPQDPSNNWYPDCINSAQDYSLNVHTDVLTQTKRFWINHKVFENGRFAGIFCAGFPYSEMAANLFADSKTKGITGYIVDNHGYILMDHTLEDSKEETKIHTINSDPGFHSAITAYLENINGYFDANTQPVVIKLVKVPYNYAAIAPIIGTNWSVVTFFDNNSLFSIWDLLPLLIIIFSMFLIYTAIHNILMYRLILSPLKRLRQDLTVSKLNANGIYGYGRNDEVGELAQTIQRMWNHLSIDNAKLLRAAREQERLIRVDQLTNIPNRRSFDERLPLEWGRAIRAKTPISLLILDLDHFKNYNDTYGHIQGDKALKMVSKIFMQELKRPGDFAARWGGEEFVVVLSNTDTDGAFDVAERILRNVASTKILLIDESESKITVSIGINTLVPVLQDSLEDFIRDADMALYTAKKEGRNRVCRYNASEKK
jgi:diguanylate cyclase (GGDEF)-like protein